MKAEFQYPHTEEVESQDVLLTSSRTGAVSGGAGTCSYRALVAALAVCHGLNSARLLWKVPRDKPGRNLGQVLCEHLSSGCECGGGGCHTVGSCVNVPVLGVSAGGIVTP